MLETDTSPTSFESKISASVDTLLPDFDDAAKDEPTDDEAPDETDRDNDDEAEGQGDTGSDNDGSDEASEDDADESDTEDDEGDPEFKQAAAKHKIAQSLDDVPEEARPLLEKKMKAMEAGYTRAMQEARAYRTEKATFDAERAYERDHPDQYIADAFAANPKLIDAVNAELERRQNPTYAAAVAKDRDVSKREAELSAKQEIDATAARMERAQMIEDYTQRAATKAGIPFELVEDAVAHAILSGGKGDITEAEVDAIIADKAKTYNKHVGAAKGAKTREYAKVKANDAKTAGVIKPKSSTGVRPNAEKNPTKPKDLRSFVSAFMDNYTQ